jgi:nickel/cobalt transporter (NicO) family protein
MRIMRQRQLTFLILLLCICGVGSVSAHPLGNFTINHFARLEIQPESIKIRYVIDMAEIPTFQELQKINSSTSPSEAELDAFLQRETAGFPRGLVVLIDGERIPLTVLGTNIGLRDGAGGMQTLRLTCDFAAPLRERTSNTHQLEFQDNNYSERIGWREIVIYPAGAVSVFNSSAYAGGITDELLNYPADLLAAPLEERVAQLSFTTGAVPSGVRILESRRGQLAVAAPQDRLAQLIATPQLTADVAVLGLLLAMGLGALHALSPGHGKAVVAAYLIGSRGTVSHAAFLGLTVTITHTAGVFALGVGTLAASEYFLPERLYPQLSFLSGLLVVGIGLRLLIRRLQAIVVTPSETEVMAESHQHQHGGRTHSHVPPDISGSKISWRSLLALGISGGMLPCPSALVVLLAAISLHRVGYGLLLVLAFSLGLALTLTAIGVVFVYAGRLLKVGVRFQRIARIVPVASAFVIAAAGTAICYAALNQAGYRISEVFSQLSAHFAS